MTDTQPVTELLLELRGGGAEALDRLYPLVYDELRRIAGSGESEPRPRCRI